MAFKINVVIDFEDCELEEILNVALGSEAYDWISKVETVGEFLKGGSIIITDSDGCTHELNRERLIKGIECYCKRLFAIDAYQCGVQYSIGYSDSVLQCALFDDVVYG